MEQNDNAYKGKTVLVTGCSGLVGKQLCSDLLAKGVHVTGYSRSEPLALIKNKDFKWKKGGILDKDSLQDAASEASILFHLAAQPTVYHSIENPQADYQDNAIGTLNVLEAAKENKARVVFASTITLYEKRRDPTPQKEHEIVPSVPYAISKYSAELFCSTYTKLFNIQTTILRFGYIFGIEAKRGPVYDAFAQLSKGPKITIYTSPDDSLDMIYVKDVSSALLKAGLSGKQGPFNIGSGDPIKVGDIIKKIAGLLDIKDPEITPSTLSHIKKEGMYHVMDTSKAKEELNWQPEYTFDAAIAEMHEELVNKRPRHRIDLQKRA